MPFVPILYTDPFPNSRGHQYIALDYFALERLLTFLYVWNVTDLLDWLRASQITVAVPDNTARVFMLRLKNNTSRNQIVTDKKTDFVKQISANNADYQIPLLRTTRPMPISDAEIVNDFNMALRLWAQMMTKPFVAFATDSDSRYIGYAENLNARNQFITLVFPHFIYTIAARWKQAPPANSSLSCRLRDLYDKTTAVFSRLVSKGAFPENASKELQSAFCQAVHYRWHQPLDKPSVHPGPNHPQSCSGPFCANPAPCQNCTPSTFSQAAQTWCASIHDVFP